MIWGAHEVDGRIAARAAVKLRAALRQSIDAKRLYQLYKESDPLVTDNEENARKAQIEVTSAGKTINERRAELGLPLLDTPQAGSS